MSMSRGPVLRRMVSCGEQKVPAGWREARRLTLWRSPVLPFPTGSLDFPCLPKLMKTKCNPCQAFEKAKPTNVHKTHTIGAVFSSLVYILYYTLTEVPFL